MSYSVTYIQIFLQFKITIKLKFIIILQIVNMFCILMCKGVPAIFTIVGKLLLRAKHLLRGGWPLSHLTSDIKVSGADFFPLKYAVGN